VRTVPAKETLKNKQKARKAVSMAEVIEHLALNSEPSNTKQGGGEIGRRRNWY
jgi:hypothetical protein